jgi:hypothetical protein
MWLLRRGRAGIMSCLLRLWVWDFILLFALIMVFFLFCSTSSDISAHPWLLIFSAHTHISWSSTIFFSSSTSDISSSFHWCMSFETKVRQEPMAMNSTIYHVWRGCTLEKDYVTIYGEFMYVWKYIKVHHHHRLSSAYNNFVNNKKKSLNEQKTWCMLANMHLLIGCNYRGTTIANVKDETWRKKSRH